MTRISLLAALAAVTLAGPLAAEIEVHDAYARSSGAMGQTGAAFMVIHNHGGPDDRLIDAISAAAARVELHTHIEEADGVMRMVHVEEGFDLPRDGAIMMQRGGHHVMFMGIAQAWSDGDTIPLTLVFEQAGEVSIEVSVDNARENTQMPMAMDHGPDQAHGDGSD